MTNSFAGVRMARPEDEDSIYALLMLLWKENGLFELTEAKVREAIRKATERRGGIIGVIEGPNGLEASVGLHLEQLWYSDDWWLVEYWNFVREEYRRSTHARRLIEFSKWCADNLGLDLFMGIVTNERTEAKVRLYRRQLPYVGGFFLHRPERRAANGSA